MTFFSICLIGWTISSVWFFLHNLGAKFRPEAWYDKFLLTPVMVLIQLYVWISVLVKLVTRSGKD